MRTDSADRPRLFDEFPPTPTRMWEKRIKADLGGGDYRTELRWHTGEGVAPLPFYRREDLEKLDHPASIPQGDNQPWQIRSAISDSTVRQANGSAREALRGGSGALHIISRLMPGRAGGSFRGSGVPLQAQSDLRHLLKDIPLEHTAVHFDAGPFSPALLAMVWQELSASGFSGQDLEASFLYDPFASGLLYGKLYSRSDISHKIYRIASFCQGNLPRVRPLAIDARTYHNSGGTIVQELGFALGVASEYLAALTDKGYSADEIANMLHFNFATGSRFFLEMAKFRALRLLWNNLLEAFKGNPEQSPAYIHAETSTRNKTGFDPYTNMLRTTTEGMSATLAGCDALTVHPFDETFREPDDFSRRIARNSQIIMREEAYLQKVRDPAAGSYYIEMLTHKIARKAWQLFQEVEQLGGMTKAITEEFIQSSIASSRMKRNRAVAHRERIFVGTSQYPDPGEKRAGELNQAVPAFILETPRKDREQQNSFSIEKLAALFDRGATLGGVASLVLPDSRGNTEPLRPYRGAREFEELRLATENHPATPKVLNLPVGNAKIRNRRSSFSNNFFGCAGYDMADPISFKNISEAVEALHRDQPDIAVLCSSDKEYRELVPALCKQIGKMKKRPLLVLAGYPEQDVKSYREAGVDLFIHPGCNVLKTLKEVQQELGIEL